MSPGVNLRLVVGEDASMDVRRFDVREGISSLFLATVEAVSPDSSLDLELLVGHAAAFQIEDDASGGRRWSGLCSYAEQVKVEPNGLSTYLFRIVPTLWSLGQRRNYRVHQHKSIPEIAAGLLGEWGIEPSWAIEHAQYPRLEYKIQYGERDLAYLTRLLEEAGIAFTFPEDGDAARLMLGDRLHAVAPRAGGPVPWTDNPNPHERQPFLTALGLGRVLRPGAHTILDHDFRSPAFPLLGEAKTSAPERLYEQFHYRPGAFRVEGSQPSTTPAADDRGVARHEPSYGERKAARALEAERGERHAVTFATNLIDLRPGAVILVGGHPHIELQEDRPLLVTGLVMEGKTGETLRIHGRAAFADEPYRPPMVTPKPRARGVQSARIVGPLLQEIHTDEFGRVRVQFPWDREGTNDERSSCWMRVSEGWGGAGHGAHAIPRVGQEVLVRFLGGDPEQPVVVGRAFNATQPVPDNLPDQKTTSIWRSQSSPFTGGFNEIFVDDVKSRELLRLQAEKDLRKLVKHDETITVGHDRTRSVGQSELDTTVKNRTEVTVRDRVEFTDGDRTVALQKSLRKRVRGQEIERVERDQLVTVGKDEDLLIEGTKRELVDDDSDIIVDGTGRSAIARSWRWPRGVGRQRHPRRGGRNPSDRRRGLHVRGAGHHAQEWRLVHPDWQRRSYHRGTPCVDQ